MLVDPIIAGAGLAELSRQESQRLCQELALVGMVPFALFSICYLIFLATFFRNPVRRQQTNARAVVALFVLWITIGGMLLVPALPFLPAALGF